MDCIDPARTGLLIVDLQNDFLHPDGAYARGNQKSADIAALPERVLPVGQCASARRAAGSSRRSSRWCRARGGALHLAAPEEDAPVSRQGRFRAGSWGQALVDELQPADLSVEKGGLFGLLHDAAWNGCCARPASTR
jgi:ureidoacrylate peracid hydrolase